MTGAITRGRVTIVLLVAVALCLPTALGTGPGQRALAAAGLSDSTAEFSELALVQHARLADTVDREGRVRFTGRLTNHAGTATSYRWTTATGTDSRELDPVRTGTLRLGAGETVDVPVKLRLPDCDQRTQVRLTVDGEGQKPAQVQYWIFPRGSDQQSYGGPTCAG